MIILLLSILIGIRTFLLLSTNAPTGRENVLPTAVDHAVIFVDENDFENPPRWLLNNFVITNGGKHVGKIFIFIMTIKILLIWTKGQPSRNKNIWFKDGTYIELFNWYEPPTDQNDPWTFQKPGIVDWGMSTPEHRNAEAHFDALLTRLRHNNADGGLGIKYDELVDGGIDGSPALWKASSPIYSNGTHTPDKIYYPTGRLDCPFVLYYTYERHVRKPESVTHPCNATGLAYIEILVPSTSFLHYVKLWCSIIGKKPVMKDETSALFDIFTPHNDGGPNPKLWLHTERNSRETEWLGTHGIGLYGIGVFVEGREGHGEEKLGENATASQISLVW